MSEPAVASQPPVRSRLLLWAAIAVLLLFIAAMATQYVRTRRVQADLSAARQQLELVRTEAIIGAAAAEAQQGRYEPARRLASTFFTNVQARMLALPAEERGPLQALLDRRDPTITLLSRADPAVVAGLARLVTDYRAIGGASTAER